MPCSAWSRQWWCRPTFLRAPSTPERGSQSKVHVSSHAHSPTIWESQMGGFQEGGFQIVEHAAFSSRGNLLLQGNYLKSTLRLLLRRRVWGQICYLKNPLPKTPHSFSPNNARFASWFFQDLSPLGQAMQEQQSSRELSTEGLEQWQWLLKLALERRSVLTRSLIPSCSQAFPLAAGCALAIARGVDGQVDLILLASSREEDVPNVEALVMRFESHTPKSLAMRKPIRLIEITGNARKTFCENPERCWPPPGPDSDPILTWFWPDSNLKEAHFGSESAQNRVKIGLGGVWRGRARNACDSDSHCGLACDVSAHDADVGRAMRATEVEADLFWTSVSEVRRGVGVCSDCNRTNGHVIWDWHRCLGRGATTLPGSKRHIQGSLSSGHVRPRQRTEICNFGAPSPLYFFWISRVDFRLFLQVLCVT